MITLIQKILKLPYFDEKIICVNFQPNHPKICLITGPNSSGKSVIRKLLHQFELAACRPVHGNEDKCNKCHNTGFIIDRRKEVEFIHISMEGRCNSSGIQKLMVYGAEDDEGTGYNSIKTFKKALQTSQSRENDHILFFDEPDIGLSDGYSAGMGIEIVNFITTIPSYCRGVFVVSHNKSLAKQLLPLLPSHLRLSDDLSIEQWINTCSQPKQLNDLIENNLKTWHKVQEIINLRKKT